MSGEAERLVEAFEAADARFAASSGEFGQLMESQSVRLLLVGTGVDFETLDRGLTDVAKVGIALLRQTGSVPMVLSTVGFKAFLTGVLFAQAQARAEREEDEG
jgi:hypothetical protein